MCECGQGRGGSGRRGGGGGGERGNPMSSLDQTGVLGGSGRVLNSLNFYQASFKSPGRFNFRCVLSSQWKAVTVNSRSLQCQL